MKEKKFLVRVVVYTSPRSDTATKLRYSSTPSNNVIGWPCKRDVFCCIAAIVPFAVPIRWQDATIRTCNTIILVKESCNIHNAEFRGFFFYQMKIWQLKKYLKVNQFPCFLNILINSLSVKRIKLSKKNYVWFITKLLRIAI